MPLIHENGCWLMNDRTRFSGVAWRTVFRRVLGLAFVISLFSTWTTLGWSGFTLIGALAVFALGGAVAYVPIVMAAIHVVFLGFFSSPRSRRSVAGAVARFALLVATVCGMALLAVCGIRGIPLAGGPALLNTWGTLIAGCSASGLVLSEALDMLNCIASRASSAPDA